MFDPAYLDRMTLEELATLEDGIIQSIDRCRRNRQWALAWFWRQQQTTVMDATYRAHMEASDARFARQQLALPGMPPRVSPEDRPAA